MAKTTSPRSRSKAFKKSGISAAISSGRGKADYNIWLFRSPKTGQDLKVHADPHFLHCCLLEADPSCRTYQIERPAETWSEGKKIESRFDTEVARRNNRVEFCEIKSHDLKGSAAPRKDQDQEERQRAIAAAHGVDYVRVHRGDLASHRILLSSVKIGLAAINAARSHSLAGTALQMSALFSRQRVWRAGSLLEQFESAARPLATACIFEAVFEGRITSDLTENLWGRHTLLELVDQGDASSPTQRETTAQAQGEARDRAPQAAQAVDHVHRATRKVPEGWVDLSAWPILSEGAIPKDQEERFNALRAALTSYLTGTSATKVAKEQGISRTELYRHLKRALTLHPDGRICGWRALRPHIRVVPYERKLPLPRTEGEFGAPNSGFSGAFKRLLVEHPTIRDRLQELALKKGSARHEPRINAGDFHTQFLRLCAAEGVLVTEYPFITKDRAAGACRIYLNTLRQSDFETGARILGGVPALTRSRVGTGQESLIAVSAPFEAVIQDGHTIDVLGSVSFPHPSGPRLIPISRARIEVVAEVRSHAVLGYELIFKAGTSTDDAAGAVQNALKKWQPLAVANPAFQYPSGGGLPSGVIPELEGAAWATFLIDNASFYTTEAILGRLRARIGCAINLGPVGDFTRRYLIEGINSCLAKRGFQRLPSTTGSGPKDTRRVDAEKEALEISYEELAYIVDVAIATYNATPLDSLAARSPIQYLRELYSGPQAPFIARQLPPLAYGQADLDTMVIERTVRGNQAEGRRPYIEFYEVPYTSNSISGSAALIGQAVDIHVKRSDLRQFEVFTKKGESLGFLRAGQGWRLVKHNLQQRIAINDLVRNKQLIKAPGEDWVQAYLRHLSERAVKQANKSSNPKVSKDAAMVAQIAIKSDLPIPEVDPDRRAPSTALRPMTLPEPAVAMAVKPRRKALL